MELCCSNKVRYFTTSQILLNVITFKKKTPKVLKYSQKLRQATKLHLEFSSRRCGGFVLTSGGRFGLRCQDNKAESFIVFALQGDVKALRSGWLNRLDCVWKLNTRDLWRGVDQGRCYMLRLLTTLLLHVSV